jgi:hypothetical protein
MCEVKDIITDDLVVIEGHDFTNVVDVVDGKIECMMCRELVEDNDDLGIYECDYGHESDRFYLGHEECAIQWQLDD